jgi:hypothetical protein
MRFFLIHSRNSLGLGIKLRIQEVLFMSFTNKCPFSHLPELERSFLLKNIVIPVQYVLPVN